MGKLFFNNKKRNLLILGYTCIMIIYFVFSTACIKAIKTPFPAISKPKIVMINRSLTVILTAVSIRKIYMLYRSYRYSICKYIKIEYRE